MIVVPAVWVAYVGIVFEILFMISPFALYYYAGYGPSLNVLHRSPWTAWLTDFLLPHFSYTSSPLLNGLPRAGGLLIALGVVLFALGFVHVYGAKLRGGGLAPVDSIDSLATPSTSGSRFSDSAPSSSGLAWSSSART